MGMRIDDKSFGDGGVIMRSREAEKGRKQGKGYELKARIKGKMKKKNGGGGGRKLE
jgi:hypothetical protein